MSPQVISLNPFKNLHEHVHGNIIQHFSRREQVQCAKVSRRWVEVLWPILVRSSILVLDFDQVRERVEEHCFKMTGLHDFRFVRATMRRGNEVETYESLQSLAPNVRKLHIEYKGPFARCSDEPLICNFLRSVADTLQVIEVILVPHQPINRIINAIFNELPLLKAIALTPSYADICIPDELEEALDLRPHAEITSAKINSCFREGELKKILRALPNLKTLRIIKIDFLSPDDLEFIACNMMKLKTLTYVGSDANYIERYREIVSINPHANSGINVLFELRKRKN